MGDWFCMGFVPRVSWSEAVGCCRSRIWFVVLVVVLCVRITQKSEIRRLRNIVSSYAPAVGVCLGAITVLVGTVLGTEQLALQDSSSFFLSIVSFAVVVLGGLRLWVDFRNPAELCVVNRAHRWLSDYLGNRVRSHIIRSSNATGGVFHRIRRYLPTLARTSRLVFSERHLLLLSSTRHCNSALLCQVNVFFWSALTVILLLSYVHSNQPGAARHRAFHSKSSRSQQTP